LSDALCGYVTQRIFDMEFPIMRGGGSLLTPQATKISQSTPVDTMAQVHSTYFGRVNEPEHYFALVFAPTADGHPQISILTAPETTRHVVKVTDDDITASVRILKQLIDDTLHEINGV
jgi:hypothetical protein